MMPTKRQELLRELIEKRKSISINEIASVLNVSVVTARRDADYLNEYIPNVERVSGGVIWNELSSESSAEYLNRRFYKQNEKNLEEKKVIAKNAALLVQNGDSMILDAGSTIFQFAKKLDSQLSGTAFITAMNIAEVLERNDNITKIVIGGIYRSKTTTMVSSMMAETISTIYADKLFIASTGISFTHGFTCDDILEADVKKNLLKSAKDVYWLVDSSKMGNIGSFQISDFDSSHTLITDDRIRKADYDKLEKLMKVVISK